MQFESEVYLQHFRLRRGSQLNPDEKNGELIGSILTLHNISNEHAMIQRLNHMATIDELTGISNRCHFVQQSQALFTNPNKSGYLACILIDIDHFKAVNDTHGQQVGDNSADGFKSAGIAFRRAD